MTTTVMRDSIVGDNWIYQSVTSNPITAVLDEKTGQPTGDFLTGPVRLTFINLYEARVNENDDGDKTAKFGVSMLFTPWHDFTLLRQRYHALCTQAFPEYWDAQTQRFHGLHDPFHDQADKLKYGGYTPGLTYMNATSKFKPPVVDHRNNPIVDPNRVYPGIWGILGINMFTFKNKKKGVGVGVQSVMIIGEDTRLGGGPPDTKKVFAGVNIQQPIVQPGAAQQMAQAAHAAQPQPGGHIPGYTPAPAPAPQYTAPAAPTYTPPAAPAPSVLPPGYVPPAPAADEDMSFLN